MLIDNVCVYVCSNCYFVVIIFFFFKQKTAYEMRISDWSSDVCSSDLTSGDETHEGVADCQENRPHHSGDRHRHRVSVDRRGALLLLIGPCRDCDAGMTFLSIQRCAARLETEAAHPYLPGTSRSEEHTSELQSLMRISYAVFCLKKKKKTKQR